MTKVELHLENPTNIRGKLSISMGGYVVVRTSVEGAKALDMAVRNAIKKWGTKY